MSRFADGVPVVLDRIIDPGCHHQVNACDCLVSSHVRFSPDFLLRRVKRGFVGRHAGFCIRSLALLSDTLVRVGHQTHDIGLCPSQTTRRTGPCNRVSVRPCRACSRATQKEAYLLPIGFLAPSRVTTVSGIMSRVPPIRPFVTKPCPSLRKKTRIGLNISRTALQA